MWDQILKTNVMARFRYPEVHVQFAARVRLPARILSARGCTARAARCAGGQALVQTMTYHVFAGAVSRMSYWPVRRRRHLAHFQRLPLNQSELERHRRAIVLPRPAPSALPGQFFFRFAMFHGIP